MTGTLADLTRAMRALADGDLDGARARVENQHVVVRSRDEVGALATSFNVILDEATKAAQSLDGAREALLRHRRELERVIDERTARASQQAAVVELGRVAFATSDRDEVLNAALALLRSSSLRADVHLFLYESSTQRLVGFGGLEHAGADPDRLTTIGASDGSPWINRLQSRGRRSCPFRSSPKRSDRSDRARSGKEFGSP